MKTPSRSIEGASLIVFAWLFVISGAVAAAPTTPGPNAPDTTTSWHPAQKVAGNLPAWFPDIALDQSGTVHIIWNSSEDTNSPTNAAVDTNAPQPQLLDFLNYQQFGLSTDSPSTDIGISHGGEAMRNSIIADRDGTIDVLYRASEHIWFIKSPVSTAPSASAWSERHLISGLGSAYYSAMAQDANGVIHVAYTENRPVDGAPNTTTTRESVYYRNSSDGGVSWSSPIRLSPTQTLGGTSRPQVLINGSTVVVAWDLGYDNINGVGDPAQGGIRRSLDGGKTWQPFQDVVDPNGPIEQVTFAFGMQNQALLVWRQTTKDVIRYRTSNDSGATWTDVATVPGITARPYLDKHQFDRYALMADSTGRIHLFAVGQLTSQDDLALFQVEFNDKTWSAPQVVFHGNGFPEYPRIATDGGNRIVLAFFVRDSVWAVGDYRVWWADGIMTSPALAPRPIPAVQSTPTPVGQTASPSLNDPTAIPLGTITLEQRPSIGNPPAVVSLGRSMFLVVALILVSAVARLWWMRRS